MYTSIFFLLFIAFLLLYNTSPKVIVNKENKTLQILRCRKQLSYRLAIILAVISLVVLLNYNGIGSGSIAYIIMVMAVGCLVVLLSPFNFISWRMVMLIYHVSLFIEIFLTK